MRFRLPIAAGAVLLAVTGAAAAGPAGAAVRPAWAADVQIAVNANSALGEVGLVTQTLARANLAPGTNPAVAMKAGAFPEVAWQASSGLLWTLDGAGNQVSTQEKVAAGSSPAIAALAGGGYEIVFTSAADGRLRQLGPDGTARPLGSGPAVAAGTSPAVAANVNGGFEAAYRAAGTGHLWTAGPGSTGHDTGAVVAAGSSPVIMGKGSGYVLVYADSSGTLRDIAPDGSTAAWGTGPAVAAGTSPAAAIVDSRGRFDTVYAAASGELWTVGIKGAASDTFDTGVAAAAHTSPAIALRPNAGGTEIAYQVTAGRELLILADGTATDAHLSLGVGDSPVMAVTPQSPTLITLQDYTGLDAAAVRDVISRAGLLNGPSTVDSSCRFDAGKVAAQNPPGGATVHLSDTVTLAVSSGRTAQGTPCHPVVPNLFGFDGSTAQRALAGQGLTVGAVTTGSDCAVQKGDVFSQDPGAGTAAQPGQAVSLVEATGLDWNRKPCITQ
jgi:PASTA domain